MKVKLKQIRGSQFENVDTHLDEYMCHYNKKNEGKMFDLLLQGISYYFPA